MDLFFDDPVRLVVVRGDDVDYITAGRESRSVYFCFASGRYSFNIFIIYKYPVQVINIDVHIWVFVSCQDAEVVRYKCGIN